jgi:hypothetical protein
VVVRTRERKASRRRGGRIAAGRCLTVRNASKAKRRERKRNGAYRLALLLAYDEPVHAHEFGLDGFVVRFEFECPLEI